MTAWKVTLTAAAIRDTDAIPPRVVPAVVEFLFGPLAEYPARVGKPLRDDFAGSYSARRGSYRVLYDIDEASSHVRVFRIATWGTAYRRR